MAAIAPKIQPETAAVLDVERVRKDFPILERMINGRPLVYLDSGASSQRPLAVLRAVEEYETHSHANVHRGVHALSSKARASASGVLSTPAPRKRLSSLAAPPKASISWRSPMPAPASSRATRF
jgi:Aminotransferase class-V